MSRNHHFFLYLLGILLILYFFSFGTERIYNNDWQKENLYYDTYRKALEQKEMPFEWNLGVYHTKNFLGNPEILITPDIFLLPILPNRIFIILHILFLYTLGYLGTMYLFRGFSVFSFTLFWMFFNFNGFIVSHSGGGHIQFTAYYLIPLLLYVFFNENMKKNMMNVIMTTLLMQFMIINGSFHIAIHCFLFLFLASLFSLKRVRDFFIVAFGTMIASAIKVFPAIMSLDSLGRPMRPGFPNIVSIINVFIVKRNFKAVFNSMKYWEFNLYIGYALFILVLFALFLSLYKYLQHKNKISIPKDIHIYKWLLVSLVMSIFSYRYFYKPIYSIPVKVFSVERVPSRFIMMLVICLGILLTIFVEHLMKETSRRKYVFFFVTLALASYEVFGHFMDWCPRLIFEYMPFTDMGEAVILPSDNLAYQKSFYLGLPITIICFGILIFFVVKNREIFAENFIQPLKSAFSKN